jgi:uncharacterized membrane protein HdeD (DUF308 family)
MEGSMSASTGMADQAETMMQALAAHWGLVLTLGILSIIIGVMAIVWPGATLLTIAILFAVWLFVSGIVSVVQSFTVHGDTAGRVLNAVLGVLSVIVGFALLRTPFQSLEVLIFVLGIFWVAQGIMTFINAFSQKDGRNWKIFSGILGVIAGTIVLIYPISSAVTLALFGGIWLIILGITQIVAAWNLRKEHKAAPAAPAAPAAVG